MVVVAKRPDERVRWNQFSVRGGEVPVGVGAVKRDRETLDGGLVRVHLPDGKTAHASQCIRVSKTAQFAQKAAAYDRWGVAKRRGGWRVRGNLSNRVREGANDEHGGVLHGLIRGEPNAGPARAVQHQLTVQNLTGTRGQQ